MFCTGRSEEWPIVTKGKSDSLREGKISKQKNCQPTYNKHKNQYKQTNKQNINKEKRGEKRKKKVKNTIINRGENVAKPTHGCCLSCGHLSVRHLRTATGIPACDGKKIVFVFANICILLVLDNENTRRGAVNDQLIILS